MSVRAVACTQEFRRLRAAVRSHMAASESRDACCLVALDLVAPDEAACLHTAHAKLVLRRFFGGFEGLH